LGDEQITLIAIETLQDENFNSMDEGEDENEE
jgi:hypothetical protein